jgi:hypothetical protein
LGLTRLFGKAGKAVPIPKISKVSNYLEIRLKGGGTSGKGDRWELLSASEARILAYALLSEAEKLNILADKRANIAAKNSRRKSSS